MTDNIASTNSPRWQIATRVVLHIAILVLVIIVLLRLYASYGLERRVNTLDHDLRTHASYDELVQRDLLNRADTLEKTLFVDVKPKMDAAQKTATLPKNVAEVWQINRDRELRDRIRQLESRMWELEHPPRNPQP